MKKYEPMSCLLCKYSDVEFDENIGKILFFCLLDWKRIETAFEIREDCPVKGGTFTIQ